MAGPLSTVLSHIPEPFYAPGVTLCEPVATLLWSNLNYSTLNPIHCTSAYVY